MKIYIVEGTTSDGECRDDWIVCAYKQQDVADEHARKAMLRAMEIHKANKYYYSSQKLNEFDPEMRIDYTGIDYNVFEVELVD
jgi:hypothetical protein